MHGDEAHFDLGLEEHSGWIYYTGIILKLGAEGIFVHLRSLFACDFVECECAVICFGDKDNRAFDFVVRDSL